MFEKDGAVYKKSSKKKVWRNFKKAQDTVSSNMKSTASSGMTKKSNNFTSK
jgi:hypothetical protein